MENQTQFTYSQKLIPADKFNEIYNGAVPSTVSRLFAVNGKSDSVSSDNFSNIIGVGKRVLCKAQGLSGGDKKLCQQQILAKCGRKPVCSSTALAILTGGASLLAHKKCKENVDKWLKCSQAQAITSGTAISGAGDTGAADTGTGADTGGSTGEEEKAAFNWKPYVFIGGAALLTAAGIALVVSNARKIKLAKLQAGK